MQPLGLPFGVYTDPTGKQNRIPGAASWSPGHTRVRSDAHNETGTRIATVVSVPTYTPELTADGVVLWRLRRTSEHQLWCVVGDFGGELTLTIYDLASDKVPVEEVHATIASLLSRADALRDQHTAAGWELVDVDLDEPD